MDYSEDDVKRIATEYVELEAHTEVKSAEVVEWFTHWGEESAVLSVKTTTGPTSEWWVVAGNTMTNLYEKDEFDNPDYVFSLHVGLMSRLTDRQHQQTDGPPEGEKYDAFISHASEDKSDLVEPLARAMKRQGMWIWYDEDELEIGDSIRRSIDKGLSNSHCGIVVFSPSFFDKSWPEYELDGIVTKMMDLEGPRLFPVWHEVDAEDVREYSPSLANIKAEITDGKDVEQIARNLRRVVAPQINR